jgi:hypothetical protein
LGSGRIRDSIEAHLTIVFAAWRSAAGSNTIPAGPSASSLRPHAAYRTVQIQAGPHTNTAAAPLPYDLRQAFEAINRARWPAHQIEQSSQGLATV